MRTTAAMVIAAAALALPGWAQEPAPPAGVAREDPVGALAVPADHPRILITAAELDAVRQRLHDSEQLWRTLQASGRRYLSDDPSDTQSRMRSLQSRSHAISRQVATLAFWGLITEDIALRTRISGWFAALDVSKIEAELPDGEYMPRGEFLFGFPMAYDWAKPWATDAALGRLRELCLTHAAICYEGIHQQKNWEGRTEANNHSMAAMGGVGLAGLALWGEHPAAKAWVRLTAQKVQSYLALSFDDQGACYEGNLYGPFGLGQALPFSAALSKLGGTDLFGDGRLVRSVHWCVSDAIPGQRLVMNPLNDASGQRFSANLTLYAAKQYRDGVAAWAFGKSDGRAWAPFLALWHHDLPEAREPGPEFHVRFHEGRGLLNVRTGFGASDHFASFEAGKRVKGTHGQSDQGQITLYAHGDWYAVDPGYSNKKDPDSGNQTLAHNLVLIDGVGQAITGGGDVVQAAMLRQDSDAVVTVAVADLKPAYDHQGHNPVMKALRTFLFVRTPDHPYVVVVDEIVKDAKAHVFDSVLHTGRDNDVMWEGNVATIKVPRGPDMRVHWLGPKVEGSTATEDYGSYLKEHPVLHARGRAVAWFSVQLFEWVGDGAQFEVKRSGKRLVISAVHSGDAESSDKLTITPGSGTRPARLELVRTTGGKRSYKKRW